jgi:hypothetical protein
MDTDEANLMTPLRLSEELRKLTLNTERASEIRKQLRNDADEPTCRKSRQLILLPNLALARRLTVDPKCAKARTEMASPNRPVLRSDIEDPKCTESNTEI